MDAIKHMLLEDPMVLYIALAVVEVGLLGLWSRRRNRRQAAWLLIPPVLAGLLALVSGLVTTDREQIIEATEALTADVSAGSVDAFRTYLDTEFTAEIAGSSFDRAAALDYAQRAVEQFDIERVWITDPTVEVTDGRAEMYVGSWVVFRGGQRTKLEWHLTWIQREAGWRLLHSDPPEQGNPIGPKPAY